MAASRGGSDDSHLKQDRARRTRQQIILAAAAVFDEVGFSAARLEDITRDAAVTKGALYFHFASKSALARAVLDAHHARWRLLAGKVETRGLDPLTSVIVLSVAVANNVRTSVIARAGVRLGNEYKIIDAELPPPFMGWIAQLTALVTAAQARGDVRPELDARAVARMIVSCYFGIQEVSMRLNDGRELRRRLDEWWALMLPVIVSDEAVTARILGAVAATGVVRIPPAAM